ncbi:MAG: hypothetical protein JJU11_18665 [Candidatus Sumerlaeia bacterium]|nr:hypothetical protein [Candidatus Sumerlaeia bacterium]
MKAPMQVDGGFRQVRIVEARVLVPRLAEFVDPQAPAIVADEENGGAAFGAVRGTAEAVFVDAVGGRTQPG